MIARRPLFAPEPSAHPNMKYLPLVALSLACLVSTHAAPSPEAKPVGTQEKPAAAPVRVNVMGAVRSPGMIELKPGSSLVDAIGQAGGFTGVARQDRVAILRGKADAKLTRVEHDVTAILKGKAVNPAVQDGDVIEVQDRLF